MRTNDFPRSPRKFTAKHLHRSHLQQAGWYRSWKNIKILVFPKEKAPCNLLMTYNIFCNIFMHQNSLKGKILKFYLQDGINFCEKYNGVSEIIQAFSIISQELHLREDFQVELLWFALFPSTPQDFSRRIQIIMQRQLYSAPVKLPFIAQIYQK